jgi:hypothetical protein
MMIYKIYNFTIINSRAFRLAVFQKSTIFDKEKTGGKKSDRNITQMSFEQLLQSKSQIILFEWMNIAWHHFH